MTSKSDAHKHYGPETPKEYFELSEIAVRSAYDTLNRLLATHPPGPIMFSEGLLAGLILQSAYTAIKLYSPPRPIPDGWKDLIEPSHNAARFCIGELKHGIPAALIVYVGGNQSAHWDEPPREVPERVFRLLANAFDDNMLLEYGL